MEIFENKNTVILEPSTNTHTLTSNNVTATDLGNGIMKIKTNGKGIVTHGEHGTIATEAPNVIKYVQQEVNPVTKKMHAAFD
jgi:hypothetical protein